MSTKRFGFTRKEVEAATLVAAHGYSRQRALLAVGCNPGTACNPRNVFTDELEAFVAQMRSKAIAELTAEGVVDAKMVLRGLVEQLARLMADLYEVQNMLGHDIGELYRMNGVLYPIEFWPDHWRRGLVTEIESEQLSRRSHDGVEGEKRGGWDVVGTAVKLKRESVLEIRKEKRALEKEIREQLKTIGQHIDVKAFPVAGEKLADAVGDLAQAINAKLQGALRRESQMIDVAPEK